MRDGSACCTSAARESARSMFWSSWNQTYESWSGELLWYVTRSDPVTVCATVSSVALMA
ncbi:MAG: hypothetical protein IPJ56_06605 [Gemmatimonadetes bacterium]|nr:hypothetical protein [Gemmatimonadota bacterium]